MTKTGLDGINIIGGEGSSSGGYLSFTLRYAAQTLFGIQLSPLDVQEGRNGVEWVYKQSSRGSRQNGGGGVNTDFAQVLLRSPENPDQVLLRFAAAYGFKNIQNVVRKLKALPPKASPESQLDERIAPPTRSTRALAGPRDMYDFVELMACPSGCINGGGQLKSPTLESRAWIGAEEQAYKWTRETFGIQTPEENGPGMRLYAQIVSNPEAREAMFHTTYEALGKKSLSSLGVKW